MRLKFISFSVLLILIIMIVQSCLQSTQQSDQKSEGEKLLASNCYSCHSPTAKQSDLLAPPMAAVKKFYQKEYDKEEDFVNAIVDFVQQPTKEKALMKPAIERFGLMAAMGFEKEKLEKMASYLYKGNLETPEWFEEHYKKMHKNGQISEETKTEKTPLTIGKNIALKTKAALGKNLMTAINERGAAGAVEFCNVQAIPITDSLAKMHHASIKRVSDKNRNPDNKANEAELNYIENAKIELAEKAEIKPQIKEENGKWVGYYPILTNAACLKCHGDKNTIDQSALAKIEKHYPDDKATGYKENELRGIWVIEMEK